MLLALSVQLAAVLFGVALVAFVGGWVARARASAPPQPPASEPHWHSPLRVDAKVSQGNLGDFSHQDRHSRYAWDYAVPEGAPVVAARSGVVVRSEFHSNIGGDTRDYVADANRVHLRHSDGTVSVYSHLAKDGKPPEVGEFVHRGELIGLSGDTGFSRGPHLHFAVLRDGASIPVRFADFPYHDGVPEKDDTHDAAVPADVPDHVLRWSKDVFRAAATAQKLGWPAIGLRFVHDLQPARGHGEHYTLEVLERLRADLIRLAARQVRRLRRRWRPSPHVALHAYRVERVLRRLHGLDDLVEPLAAFREALPDRIRRELRPCVTPLRTLVRGMTAQCRGNTLGAMESYAGALTNATPPILRYVRSVAQRLARRYIGDLKRQMARQAFEAKRCDDRRRVAVVRDTEHLVAEAEAFLRHAATFLPSDHTLAADLERHRTMVLERLL